VSHANAPLTPQGRLLLCRRIEGGSPIAHVASAMGISRRCASKWWHRYLELGTDGLFDRSSRPRNSPGQTPAKVEDRICRLRRKEKLGPDRLGGRLNMPASTVHRVLVRHDLNRLSHVDRQTGEPIRRYERKRPGELVHVDVKKLGKVPPGGGHKVRGRAATAAEKKRRTRIGFAYVHSAVDDHSRLAYSEVLPDETGPTSADFWRRAEAFFSAHGIVVERVMTDNAWAYKGKDFNDALDETGVKHRYCRPYRPQTNGKVERFNRTLLEEWAYVRPYRCESVRTRALDPWLHRYNYHRVHTAIGDPPISRVTNVPGDYI
jgi:transposase InsO family protein